MFAGDFRFSADARERIVPGVDLALSGGLHLMTPRKRKSHSASRPVIGALARWETEGGALGSAGRGRDGRVPFSEQEAHILQCLGAAVLLQWNDLPTHVQRELFEHSIAGVEPREIALLKEQIARFLHKHKDDNRHRK
jgi:hypothetical protein